MISKSEMTIMYESACAKSRRDPDVSEFKAWTNKLAMFEKRDVADALVEWSGQSRFLPTAAELLPIASRIRNSRLVRATEPKRSRVGSAPHAAQRGAASSRRATIGHGGAGIIAVAVLGNGNAATASCRKCSVRPTAAGKTSTRRRDSGA